MAGGRRMCSMAGGRRRWKSTKMRDVIHEDERPHKGLFINYVTLRRRKGCALHNVMVQGCKKRF